MSIAGLIVGLGIVALTLAYIIAPLLRRETVTPTDMLLAQKQRERLLMVYDRVLTNLRDLDEDHSTGKMPDEDYTVEREIWVQRGVEVLKALDELSEAHPLTASAEVEDIDDAIDRRVEAAIREYRKQAGS